MSLRYPACNAHAPYCHLWPVRLSSICPHYLNNGTIIEEKSYWTQNVCFDFLYNFHLIRFSFYEELREILLQMYMYPHAKYSLFLTDFNKTWNILDRFPKKKKLRRYQISWKSVEWEPKFFHADGQTDMTKPTVASAVLQMRLNRSQISHHCATVHVCAPPYFPVDLHGS